MSRTELKGSAMLAPVPPVLVTCSDGTRTNVLTIGWTGIICTKPALTYISVRPERYSYDIIKKSGEFVINLATEAMLNAVDFCGVKSGKELNKLEACGLKTIPSQLKFAPIIETAPIALECRIKDITSYGSHDMFLSEIVGVSVDDSIMNRDGKICLERCGLLAYAHGGYYSLGKSLGTFGFSVKKKKKRR